MVNLVPVPYELAEAIGQFTVFPDPRHLILHRLIPVLVLRRRLVLGRHDVRYAKRPAATRL